MKKIYLWVLLLATFYLIGMVHGQEKILRVDMLLNKTDWVKLEDISTLMGYPTKDFPEGKYSAKLLSSGGKILTRISFFVSFLHLSNPPVELSKTGRTLFLKYFENVQYLVITKGDKRLLVYEIGNKLCNNDGNCGGMETYYSCPQDCPLGSKDEVCIKDKDSVCDPDCFLGVDPDCEVKKEGGRGRLIAFLPYLGFLFIILISVIFFYKKLKQKEREEVERKREEFRKLKRKNN